MPKVPPWPSPFTLLPLKGGAHPLRHDSAAKCTDGRIIYVWASGNALYQCHYPDIAKLLGANNASATTGVDVAPSIGMNAGPQATVWRSPAGGLFLFVTATPAGSTINRVWKSASGNGESAPGVPDWAVWGTIQTVAEVYKDQQNRCIGVPFVTGSGRWVLTAPNSARWQGVWTSDNGGVSWTLRQSIGFYFDGQYGYGQCRNVVSYGGALYWSASGNVEPAKGGKSTDGGTTWPVLAGQGRNLRGASFHWPDTRNSDLAQPINADSGGMYVCFDGVFYNDLLPVGLEYTPDPAYTPRASRINKVPSFPGGLKGILQRIDDHDCYMISGYIMVIPDTEVDFPLRMRQQSWDALRQQKGSSIRHRQRVY